MSADLHWRDRAACAGLPDFPNLRVQVQKRFCQKCPVTAACLDLAMSNEVGRVGQKVAELPVYGGLSGAERLRLRKALR